MEIIRTYTKDTEEHAKLTQAARYLTEHSPKGIRYTVDNTWFDYGQRWMWTTLIATRPDGIDYQALCPRDFEKILRSGDIPATMEEIRSDKWWMDR